MDDAQDGDGVRFVAVADQIVAPGEHAHALGQAMAARRHLGEVRQCREFVHKPVDEAVGGGGIVAGDVEPDGVEIGQRRLGYPDFSSANLDRPRRLISPANSRSSP